MFNFAQLGSIVTSLRATLKEDYEGILDCHEAFRTAEDASEPTDGIAVDREYAEARYRETLATLQLATEHLARLRP